IRPIAPAGSAMSSSSSMMRAASSTRYDARRPQEPARLAWQPAEARVHHPEHCLRQRIPSTLRVGRDQLLQVEGIPLRELKEPGCVCRGDGVPEHTPHELFRRAAGERAETELLYLPLIPEMGERVVHRRSRKREHNESPIAELVEQPIDELDR